MLLFSFAASSFRLHGARGSGSPACSASGRGPSHMPRVALCSAAHASCPALPCPTQHAMLPDAHNRIVPNRLFTGVAYPEKLESYMHRTAVPGGPTLAQDLRGTWSIHYDPFKQIAICRQARAACWAVAARHVHQPHAATAEWSALQAKCTLPALGVPGLLTRVCPRPAQELAMAGLHVLLQRARDVVGLIVCGQRAAERRPDLHDLRTRRVGVPGYWL